MANSKVVIVYLRQPRKNPDEMRSDPFWEFGSFGCTKCHARLLRRLHRTDNSDDIRLAFVQGGNLGTRLVYVTPKIETIHHGCFVEAKWQPVEMPITYKSAPVLADKSGYSDCPAIIDLFEKVRKPTPVSQFASKFRSRNQPLPNDIGLQLLEIYHKFRKEGAELAGEYTQALPFPPPNPDKDRESTYNKLLSHSQLKQGRKP